MNKLFLVFAGVVGLAMGQSVTSIPAATGGGGGGGGITSCGVGQTLNGAACDNNPAVMSFNTTLQTTDAQICRSTTGNDTYVCTLTPVPTGLGNGTTGSLTVVLTADTGNTGPSTLNVNSLGAKALQNPDGTDATIVANKPYTFRYDGTQFVLQGGGGGGTSGTSFSQVFPVAWCDGGSGGTFKSLMPMASFSGTTSCYSGYQSSFAAMHITGINQYIAVSVPVSVAVSSLRVGVRAYSNSGSGTVQVQTACVASGGAIGAPAFTTQANTISLTSSAGDGQMIGFATNTVSCAAGNMLSIRANWSVISGTNFAESLYVSW